MKIAKCKMTKDKNLNTFLSPASLEAAEHTWGHNKMQESGVKTQEPES
jgi:hypothetical protein